MNQVTKSGLRLEIHGIELRQLVVDAEVKLIRVVHFAVDKGIPQRITSFAISKLFATSSSEGGSREKERWNEYLVLQMLLKRLK